jgi:hypothetical protein
VAQITAIPAPRKPVDAAAIRALTDRMPPQKQDGGDFIREVRDGERRNEIAQQVVVQAQVV